MAMASLSASMLNRTAPNSAASNTNNVRTVAEFAGVTILRKNGPQPVKQTRARAVKKAKAVKPTCALPRVHKGLRLDLVTNSELVTLAHTRGVTQQSLMDRAVKDLIKKMKSN